MTNKMPDISEANLDKTVKKLGDILQADSIIERITNNIKDADRDTVINTYKDQFSLAKQRSNELEDNALWVSGGRVALAIAMFPGFTASLDLAEYQINSQEQQELHTEVADPEHNNITKPSENSHGIMLGSLTGVFLLASVAIIAYGQKLGRKVRENIKNDIAQFKNGPKAP